MGSARRRLLFWAALLAAVACSYLVALFSWQCAYMDGPRHSPKECRAAMICLGVSLAGLAAAAIAILSCVKKRRSNSDPGGAHDDEAESADPATADAPRKRPFFQYHLSTLIVLMFVAAGLLWLNMSERPDPFHSRSAAYGWPNVMIARDKATGDWFFLRGVDPRTYDETNWSTWNKADGFFVHPLSNLAVAASSLFLVACMCEFAIRRRERQ